MLQVDPTLTRADRLVGQVLGEVGALPDVYTELEINFFLLRRLLGVRTAVCSICPDKLREACAVASAAGAFFLFRDACMHQFEQPDVESLHR